VTTRYVLHASDRTLVLETTLENRGRESIELSSVGDAVEWGAGQKVAPGKADGFKGPSRGAYVGAVGRFASYAMTTTEGRIDGQSGSSWTDTAVASGVKVGPGQRFSYARLLVVGERPDTTSLVGELAMAAGQPVGELEVRMAGGPPGTGEIVALRASGSSEVLTMAAPFAGWLPVGRYSVGFPGEPAGQPRPVEIAPGTRSTIELAVAPRAELEVGCRTAAGDGMPCKLTFEGRGGTATPRFGVGSAAGPAGHQVTTAGPAVPLRLAPGSYRVTASRGPEYSLDEIDVDVRPGERGRRLWLSPARVVDTSGYVGCDFHQHTLLGADASVATRDRVISNVAEGVEVAVASEHNLVADLEPLVRELGLERELVAIAGDEITSDASRRPWGHANAWPMRLDPVATRGGAPSVRDRTPGDVFEELRRAAGATGRDFVLQVNHPRSGKTGYFDLLGFDAGRAEGTVAGYDGAFDALEVWNGRNVEARARVLDDFRALLRAGRPVTATADTDTHGVVRQEAGYPRTYVRVDDDGHLDTWDASRTAGLVRGVKGRRDVVLTNGPMLRLSANGAPIGGIATVARGGRRDSRPGGTVTVKVHVECAPWVDVDTVSLVRAGEGPREPDDKNGARVETMHVALSAGRGARSADVVFEARFDRDDAFFIVATGKKPLAPILEGPPRVAAAPRGDEARGPADARDASDAETTPWAMTGAVWVDADGDGASLAR
jgi:hypothetical protein